MFDLLKLRNIGDTAQKNFPPEWVLRTAASFAKKWFLEQLARAVSVVTLAEIWDMEPAEAQERLAELWTYLREEL